MSPEQARGEEAGPPSDLYALGVLFFEMLTGQLPFRSNDRDTLLEMQRTAPPPKPSAIKPDTVPAAEAVVLKLLEKERRKRYQDAHHLHEELKALQRALPQAPFELQSTPENQAPPPPPPPQSPGVIEWANRAALFSRMVSRVYPTGNMPPEIQAGLDKSWELASRATRLEGEVASHTRKLESLERRGRALRAEIGRKVEELAHEESRALREAASEQQEATKLRELVQVAERAAGTAKAQADQAAQQGGNGTTLRAIFERCGGAAALLEARREALGEREQKAGVKDAQAKDLRRQIDELRAQLARYAEALEEDLAAGREKVASRTREGLSFEKAFSEVSTLLVTHLKTKPEARDLIQELMATMHGAPAGTNVAKGAMPGGPESRGPVS
jgi:serine/threonine-protein kinase